MTTLRITEGHLFGLLRDKVVADLIGYTGWNVDDCRSLVDFYDPRNPFYLDRVDAWQRLLCAGVVTSLKSLPKVLEPLGVIHRTEFNTFSILAADPWLVKVLHQIVKLLYKYRGKPRKVVDWQEVVNRLSHPLPITLHPADIEDISSRARKALVPPFDWSVIKGRFGPGVTADKCTQYSRWAREFSRPCHVPESLYCYGLHDWINTYLSPVKYGVTRMAEVPKSLKTNRFVSSEPAGFMFAQLAVGDALVRELHRSYGRHVSLYDQAKHNALLYKDGYCSIDLSDASDHVSRRLVAQLLPHWKEFLFSVRSTFGTTPDGKIFPFRAFAPMGSGVCFPVLTAVCTLLMQHVCEHSYHVYGDDIIVHVEDYDAACEILTQAGLVVNRAKSCSNIVYRESCGVELFHSYKCDSPVLDITPRYLRVSPEECSAQVVEDLLRETSEGLQPLVATFTTYCDLALASGVFRGMSYNRRYQFSTVISRVSLDTTPKTRLDGYPGLNRWFLVQPQDETDGLYKLPSRNRIGYRPVRDSTYPYAVARWLKRANDS